MSRSLALLSAAVLTSISAAALLTPDASYATSGDPQAQQQLAFTKSGAAFGAVAPVQNDQGVVVNEIIYDKTSGYDEDRVELFNAGSEAIDLTGWQVADDKREPTVLPPGIVIQPGEFIVLQNGIHFDFGLGKGDAFFLFDASGAEKDGYAYEATAPLGTWARCADGTGPWAHATVVTPGSANRCDAVAVTGKVVLNEIDSQPADWVELVNTGTTAIDISGFELRDNSDDHRWRFLAGTEITANSFVLVEADTIGLVFDDQSGTWAEGRFDAAIGIGSADKIRLYDAAGQLADDSGTWSAHPLIDGESTFATLARCPDGVGDFGLAHSTPGATNSCVTPNIVINEIESNGDVTDWVEVINLDTIPVDISGWYLLDNDPLGHATDVTPKADGTILLPGEYAVFDGGRDFTFGLGGNDLVTIRNANGLVVAEQAWSEHAAGVLGRCVDGSGSFADLQVSTKGLRNACGNPVRINEVVTQPVDWVELVNPTAAPLDVSGIVLKDDDDSHEYVIAEGTEIAAGGYLVLEDFGFGLGKADQVRLFEDSELIDETTWGPEHPQPSWGRCADTSGTFVVTERSTKGAANRCVGDIDAQVWPGSSEVRVLDEQATFLGDSSGLDAVQTAEGVVLWAVDNGTGTFWKLNAAASGSATVAPGWETGKRARFIHDAQQPDAAGPDAEGITIAGDGMLYIASERDNSAKSVNNNVVLQIDPNAPGPDVVASAEWDLTQVLPAVSANLGMEAIEWVADSELAATLWDVNTAAPYNPADYPGHGDGLFFVAVEDQGQVFAIALQPGGVATIVAELRPSLGGVMALDYDSVLGVLWAVCDDGCEGTAARIMLNGTDAPAVDHVLRPAGMPNINNEGFATAPASLISNGVRPAWWFADGYPQGSMRAGSLAAEGIDAGGGAAPGKDGAVSSGSGLAATGSSSSIPIAGVFVLLLMLAGLSSLVYVRNRNAKCNKSI